VTRPDDRYDVGYCKPPKHAQFPKGRSGNPKGRPKGSQSLSTVLHKAARQRVNVTTNGKSRSMTKLEATATQLSNQAASCDPRAIRDFLFWQRQFEEPAQADPGQRGAQEIDRSVMENILKRIRQSEESASRTDPKMTKSSQKEE